MAKAQELIYAVVGAGDFAAEKVRNVRRVADRKNSQKLYRDFVKRGRSVWTQVRSSGPTKQAIAQTKTARTQVKAAATSVTKAFRADSKAAKSAATKATSGNRSAKAS